MSAKVPLLIEWTPGSVRSVDPALGTATHGATIAECRPEAGRDAVVAIGRRSAFVRSLPVPAGSKADVARVVQFKLMADLPLDPKDTVFGFRVSRRGERIASAAAIRAESLVRVHAEAQAAGVRVRTVIPVAYGAWLATRERSLSSAAVVGYADGALSVDVVDGFELVYSRVIPTETPGEDAADEISRSLANAGVAPSIVLTLGSFELPGGTHDPKEGLLRLADRRRVDELLFSLELPARREARHARARRWRVRRALLVAGLAAVTSGYAYFVRIKANKPPLPAAGLATTLRDARAHRAAAQARLDAATRANRVLDVAFVPAQTSGDVVSALSNGVPPDAWVTSLSVARGAPTSVAGYALRGKDVGRYFAALAKNPRFSGMHVVTASVATVGKTPVVQFLVTGEAVGTAPFDRPLGRKRKDAKARPKDR